MVIISHVKDGLEIAREYNIPDDLKWKRLEELNRNNINIILS